MTHVKVDGHGPYEVDMPVGEVVDKVSGAGGGRFHLPLAGGHVVVINPSAAAVIEIREGDERQIRKALGAASKARRAVKAG